MLRGGAVTLETPGRPAGDVLRRDKLAVLHVEATLTALPALPVVVVTAPACHFCEEATEHLAEVAARHPLDIREVPITSPEGAALVAQHRPALNPLVLVDGQFFSAGRLPRRKLDALLRAREDGLRAEGVATGGR